MIKFLSRKYSLITYCSKAFFSLKISNFSPFKFKFYSLTFRWIQSCFRYQLMKEKISWLFPLLRARTYERPIYCFLIFVIEQTNLSYHGLRYYFHVNFPLFDLKHVFIRRIIVHNSSWTRTCMMSDRALVLKQLLNRSLGLFLTLCLLIPRFPRATQM